jgi:hypothetical protein
VKELATILNPVFVAEDLHQEAVSALLLFQKAALQDALARDRRESRSSVEGDARESRDALLFFCLIKGWLRRHQGADRRHSARNLSFAAPDTQCTSKVMPRRPRGGRPRAAGLRRSLLVLRRGYLSGRHRDRHRDAPDLFEHHYDQSSGRCGQVLRRYDLVPHRHDPVPHRSEPSPHHSEPDGYRRELEMHRIDRVLHHRESVSQRYEQDLHHRNRIPTHVEPATHHSQRLPCHSMLGL